MRKIALVIGSTAIDKNIQDGVSFNKIGGVTTYSGFTFRAHGIKTIIVTNIAERDKFILDFFIKNDILVEQGYSDSTTRFVNINSGDNRTQMMPAYASPITLEQIQRVENDADVIYLGPLHPNDISESVFEKTLPNNITVCLDIQGYVRKIVDDKVEKYVSNHLKNALTFSDIIKAESKELELVLNYYGLTLPKLIENFNIREIVVTSGKSGGYVMSNSLEKTDFKSYPAEKVVDPTGAGDVFFATYVISRIYNKLDINDSCVEAARTASKHVSGNYFPYDMLTIHDTKS